MGIVKDRATQIQQNCAFQKRGERETEREREKEQKKEHEKQI